MAATSSSQIPALDVDRIRQDFPILTRSVYGKPLVYLDNAATSQKPRQVIDVLQSFWKEHNANVHRGVHLLSQEASELYEGAREKVRAYINADSSAEIVFTKGCTEAINLVAYSWGRSNLRAGDEIVISAMEHHANIVSWQLACELTGAKLRVAPIDDDGNLIFEEYVRLLNGRTKMVAMTYVSNALGTINPIADVVREAKRFGAATLVDGAQSSPHLPVDVQALDCDFYTISCHKMLAPTGVGVLYGKREILEAMPPFHGGGDMIRTVSFEETTYNDVPFKFEAGTPNIAGVIGLGAAIDYIEAIGRDRIAAHEDALLSEATRQLDAVPGVRIIGRAKQKASVLSFVMDSAHPHDIGTVLDREGVAIRAGHHCCMPLMQRMGVPATARASFAFINTFEDVQTFIQGVNNVNEVFA